MHVIHINKINEKTEEKRKGLSWEEIRKEEGVYRRIDVHPEVQIRYIVIRTPRIHSLPVITILYYCASTVSDHHPACDQTLGILHLCDDFSQKNKRFIKTDEQIYMEVK